MVNHANSKVYKIWSPQGNKIYIGSTTKQYLSQRMDKHRTDYKWWKNESFNFITSFTLFEEYGIENCFIELLEAKECKSKDELLQLEGKYIRELTCVNKVIPNRTRKEYYIDNKDEISERSKEYRANNKEKILAHMKEYYNQNKEQKIDYQMKYRESNKEKITERQNRKVDCECGGKYTQVHQARHSRTIMHCQYIDSQITKPEDDVI